MHYFFIFKHIYFSCLDANALQESSAKVCVTELLHSKLIGKSLCHLDMGNTVTKSNLSKVNEQRAYRIFEDYVGRLIIGEARSLNDEKVFRLDSHIYTFDSTTIDLCLEVFEWEKFRKHKRGIKIHTLYNIEA